MNKQSFEKRRCEFWKSLRRQVGVKTSDETLEALQILAGTKPDERK